MTNAQPDTQTAQTLVDAVEMIVDSPATIERVVARMRGSAAADHAVLSRRIISHYSNLSALYGGATALPGLVPGGGTLLIAAGSALADVTLVLKTEIEMCMALSCAHGFDIRKREERQLAFLLASIKTHEAATGRNVLVDAGEISFTAITLYGPREVGKVLLKVLAIFVVAFSSQAVGKAILRAIPLVGIGVGAGVNKVLTTRVGQLADRELELRKRLG